MEFLGVDNMVAIVCGSRSAVQCIGLHDVYGKVDISKGLHGFAMGRNILISGRFRVICLTDEARYDTSTSTHFWMQILKSLNIGSSVI